MGMSQWLLIRQMFRHSQKDRPRVNSSLNLLLWHFISLNLRDLTNYQMFAGKSLSKTSSHPISSAPLLEELEHPRSALCHNALWEDIKTLQAV
jgi:hypothetical protein